METRKLAHTDLTVSRAAFGTMPFGTQADQATSTRMVDMCIDGGITFFDTANVYNQGVAETVLGNALKGRRDKIVLASKVGFEMKAAPDETGLSRGAILKSVESSLARLQTDYLDLYYLHVPDRSVPIEESLEAMDRLVRAGKVRYPASSNYAGWEVAEMFWISEKNGYRPPYISQPMYNLLARGIEQEYLAMCKRFGRSTAVYNPLAGGLLTGKQPRERPEAGTRFDNNQLYLNRYWHPAYFEAVDELHLIAKQSGRSAIDIALNWLLEHTAADVVILGASKPEQLQQNLDAFGRGPLPEEAVKAVDAMWDRLKGITPKYNR